MQGQRRLLPSISMLAAFNATARNGSLSGAARDLNLTQGAVSRQVAALEKQLGTALVARRGRGIELTAVGKAYAEEIHGVLAALRKASLNAISSPLSCTLNLAILPTFGTRWLMARFPGFLQRHPDITINFVTRLVQFDFGAEPIDAAIHFGAPDWPRAVCTFLMGEESIPVCSPRLMDDLQATNLQDLHNLPLLHLESRADAWQNWFAANGQRHAINSGGMLFEQFSLAIQAAVAGVGVALLPRFLITGELDRGELIVLSEKTVKTELAYYLVTPETRADYAPVIAFRDWLLSMTVSDYHSVGK
jgi:LysR family transcriptional regulator, glycine cleavage system transcriptional activator